MKKFTNLLVLMLLFSSCATAVKSKEYYCKDVHNDEGYNFSQIYDTNETAASCDSWKDEFWQKHSPGAYNDCLKEKEQLKAAYKSGKCSPVVVKVHNFGSTKCKIKLNYKYKQKLGKSCSGPESHKYMKKLDYMYHEFD